MLSTSHLAPPLSSPSVTCLCWLCFTQTVSVCFAEHWQILLGISASTQAGAFIWPPPRPPFFLWQTHKHARHHKDTPLILLSSLSERRRVRSLARQSPASVPSLNVVMFSSKKSENNEGEKEWWTASPWNFEKGYKKRHTKELVGWCGVFFWEECAQQQL